MLKRASYGSTVKRDEQYPRHRFRHLPLLVPRQNTGTHRHLRPMLAARGCRAFVCKARISRANREICVHNRSCHNRLGRHPSAGNAKARFVRFSAVVHVDRVQDLTTSSRSRYRATKPRFQPDPPHPPIEASGRIRRLPRDNSLDNVQHAHYTHGVCVGRNLTEAQAVVGSQPALLDVGYCRARCPRNDRVDRCGRRGEFEYDFKNRAGIGSSRFATTDRRHHDPDPIPPLCIHGHGRRLRISPLDRHQR